MSHYEKNKDRKHFQEEKFQAFRCGHCRAFVVMNEYIGTANRNHCNFCLWSKHVDIKKGDRNSDCQSGMSPVGLTMKREGFSRWGELMLIHLCIECHKVSINRIAGDDSTEKILEVFEDSGHMDLVLQKRLERQSIIILTKKDRREVEVQLFGK